MHHELHRSLFFLAFALAPWLLSTSALSQVPPPNMEVGTVNAVNESFQSVAFQSPYAGTPLVFALLPADNASPSILRIRNVTSTGFEIAQLEADNAAAGGASNDGVVTPSNVSYFAIEPGSGTIGTLNYEAGSISTSAQQHGNGANFTGSESYDTVSYTSTFTTAPAVVSFVQTMNNTGIETLSTAINETLAIGGFDVALQLAEVDSGTPASPAVDESIGYFAIERGVTTFTTPDGTTITLEAIDTGLDGGTQFDELSGGPDTQSFNATFTDPPTVIASGTDLDGADGYWLRLVGATATGATLFAQEDQHADGEVGHANETASILAFSAQFNTVAVPEPASIAIWSLIGLGLAGFGYFRVRRKRSQYIM